jgi:hypothetical protein
MDFLLQLAVTVMLVCINSVEVVFARSLKAVASTSISGARISGTAAPTYAGIDLSAIESSETTEDVVAAALAEQNAAAAAAAGQEQDFLTNLLQEVPGCTWGAAE